MDSYYAIALQTKVHAVNGCSTRDEARSVMDSTLERLKVEIFAAKKFVGSDVRLVVLPEYFLTAYPMGDTIKGWADKAALLEDGPEYAKLGEIAKDNDIFISGNAYEVDAHFDELYFQTSFIIDPKGDVILRYRRLNSMYSPTPHDVWDKYLDIYGIEGVFPVADTEIGRLACIASEEILYPEIARMFFIRGAEVGLHSTGEIGSTIETPKSISRKARAVENMGYIVSANSGGISGHSLPVSSTDGKSVIIDYRGIVLAESGWGPTMTAFASIDLAALRRYRQRPGMGNYLSRQRFELFADGYANLATQKANNLMQSDGSVREPKRSDFEEAQQQALDIMRKRGFFN